MTLLLLLACASAPPADTTMYAGILARTDADRDGTLDEAEYEAAAPKVHTTFAAADLDHDGRLTRDELAELVHHTDPAWYDPALVGKDRASRSTMSGRGKGKHGGGAMSAGKDEAAAPGSGFDGSGPPFATVELGPMGKAGPKPGPLGGANAGPAAPGSPGAGPGAGPGGPGGPGAGPGGPGGPGGPDAEASGPSKRGHAPPPGAPPPAGLTAPEGATAAPEARRAAQLHEVLLFEVAEVRAVAPDAVLPEAGAIRRAADLGLTSPECAAVLDELHAAVTAAGLQWPAGLEPESGAAVEVREEP